MISARKLTQRMTMIGALATAALITYASLPIELDSLLVMIGILLWGVVPYWILSVAAKQSEPTGHWPWWLASATGLITTIAFYIYYVGMFVEIDAQGALMFIAVPFFQIAAAASLVILGHILRKYRA